MKVSVCEVRGAGQYCDFQAAQLSLSGMCECVRNIERSQLRCGTCSRDSPCCGHIGPGVAYRTWTENEFRWVKKKMVTCLCTRGNVERGEGGGWKYNSIFNLSIRWRSTGMQVIFRSRHFKASLELWGVIQFHLKEQIVCGHRRIHCGIHLM